MNDERTKNRNKRYYSSQSKRTYAPYVFGSEVQAPDFKTEPYVKSSKKREVKSPVVVQGGKSQAKSLWINHAIKLAIYVIAFVCIVGAINVTLSAATLASTKEASSVTQEIEQARQSGKELEVKLGSLSNPTRIKEEATKLGMVEATETIKIDLSNDIVALDDNGNLSLNKSIENAKIKSN